MGGKNNDNFTKISKKIIYYNFDLNTTSYFLQENKKKWFYTM